MQQCNDFFLNTISGTGAVVQGGGGTTTVTGTNTYSGGTYLYGGTLSLGGSGAIGTSGPIFFQGGTLQFSASNTTDYSSRFSSSSTNFSIDTNGINGIFFGSPLTGSGSLTVMSSSGGLRPH